MVRKMALGAALGLLLGVGCAGSGGGASGHSMAIVGSVDSPFLSPLKARFGVNNLTGGVSDPEKAELLVFDGDTIAPNHLASGGMIERALKAGRHVLIVDAKEAQQKALMDLGLLGVYNAADSHAVMFSPYSLGNGKAGIHTLVAKKKDRTFHKHTTQLKNGALVVGKAQTVTETPDVTKGFTDDFAAQVGNYLDTPWVDPIASQVPTGVIWTSNSVTQFDVGPYANLDGQGGYEVITYIYRVFLNNGASDPSQFNQLFLIETDGYFMTGQPIHNNVITVEGDLTTQELGWADILASVSNQIDRTPGNGGGNQLSIGVSPLQATDGSWSTNLDYPITYKAADGSSATWNTNLLVGPTNVADFSAAITQGPDPIATFYQTDPFNALNGDYQNEQDPSTGELLGVADAATGAIDVSMGTAFQSTGLINDRVVVNHATSRNFVDFLLVVAEPSGVTQSFQWNTAIQPGNERVIVDFAKALPSSSPGGKK